MVHENADKTLGLAKKRQRSLTVARRLWRDQIRAFLPQLLAALVVIALLASTTGAYPLIIKYSYDMLASGKLDGLWIILPAIVLVTMTKGLLDYLQAILTSRIGIRLNVALQKRLLARILHADYARLTRDAPGQLTSRVVNDLGSIQGAVTAIFTNAIKDVLTVIALAGSMIYLDWVMSFFVLILYPFAAIPIVIVGRLIHRNAHRSARQAGNTTAALVESLSSIRLLKTFRLEAYATKKVGDEFDRVTKLQLKTVRTRAALNPILEVIGGTAVAGVIGFAAYRVSKGSSTVGDFTGFVSALLMAAQPIRGLGNLNSRVQEGLVGAERYYEVIDEVPSIASAPGAKSLVVSNAAIEFNRVAFAYTVDAPEAVRNFDLKISPRTTVALVGTSGAGKSTIINLVPRLYDVTSGSILIDGQDIRDVTVESLRDAISIVSQDITLFNDTIAANIGLGRLSAPFDEIVSAAKAAAAHAFILDLPQGYETIVGDRGMRLSGGQRQRIALARAILRDAPIFLLDEATSALDTESERLVQEALASFSATRTTIVIAHRLSTIKNADLICVMESGRIIERGTHSELLRLDAAYAKFCRAQNLDSVPVSTAAE